LAASRGQPTRSAYVTVIDAKGKPVTGLTKEDFTVRLGQEPQEVLGLAPAVEPASVVIFTDRLGLNSTYTPPAVGDALRGFARALRQANPDSRVALTTFDGTVVELTKFASAFAETDRALGRLITNSEGAALFDGLSAVCKAMQSAPTDRRIIFTLFAQYRPDLSALQPEHVREMLRRSGASLWVVEVRQVPGSNITNPAREQVLDQGSRWSGGLRQIVASPSGMMAATKHMAELILGQYLLSYGPGGGTDPTPLIVEVKRPGVRVLAPGWTTR